jgi:hypothetical protein
MRHPVKGDRVSYFHRPGPDAEPLELEAVITGVHDAMTVDLAVPVNEQVLLNKREVQSVALRPLGERAGAWDWRPIPVDDGASGG